ncbi:MAG: flagellar biosynthetic protein FliO [Anaerolineae bacterium]|nr:flagellar biosynthetic protein FliO [Anaerolineae bacterium]
MKKNKRWWNETSSVKKWSIFLIVGACILLLSGQLIQSSPIDQPVNKTSILETQEMSTSVSDKDDLFLSEYNPESDTFFNSETSDENFSWHGGSALVFKLAFVLGMIYLVMRGLRWLQKNQQSTDGNGAAIRILETTGLAPGRNLHLIVVGEKTLLIGTTEQQFTLLAELDNIIPPLQDDEEVKASASLFEEVLQKQQQPQTALSVDWDTALNGLRTGIQRFRESVTE